MRITRLKIQSKNKLANLDLQNLMASATRQMPGPRRPSHFYSTNVAGKKLTNGNIQIIGNILLQIMDRFLLEAGNVLQQSIGIIDLAGNISSLQQDIGNINQADNISQLTCKYIALPCCDTKYDSINDILHPRYQLVIYEIQVLTKSLVPFK